MIKHIFCDLDGTLYHNNTITKEDIEAIKSLKDESIVFNIATGRVFSQAIGLIEDKFDIDGCYISENGSYINNNDREQIFKGTIDDDIVKKVIARFESENATLYFKHGGVVVLAQEEDCFKNYSRSYTIDEDFIKRDSFDDKIGNIGVVSKDIEELSRIEMYMKLEFDEVLDIYFSSENTLNFVPKGISKRSAIERVCNDLNISIDEIATIGDSPNDINMLENMKYSFAMAHARESVAVVANYKAKSVADAINQIKKINSNK